jgi:glycosyltransferase involved in cell wall biosynthesis
MSVIIPAHNESAVIARTLSAMLTGQKPGEMDVIVVCNGCTDDTVAIVRRVAPTVRVIETNVASKIAALNLGDRAAAGFPRIYVDADISISIDDLRALARELDQGNVLAVAPLPRFDTHGCSWPVRAYYDIHQRLPASREGIGGSGVYAMSEAGRRRFGEFPNVVADDGFVRLQFAPAERRTLAECHSIVRAPRTLGDLLAIKTRSQFGTAELRQLYVDRCCTNVGRSNRPSLIGLACNPLMWSRLGAYMTVKLIVRNRAAKRRCMQRRSAEAPSWDRDETTRARQTDAEILTAVPHT